MHAEMFSAWLLCLLVCRLFIKGLFLVCVSSCMHVYCWLYVCPVDVYGVQSRLPRVVVLAEFYCCWYSFHRFIGVFGEIKCLTRFDYAVQNFSISAWVAMYHTGSIVLPLTYMSGSTSTIDCQYSQEGVYALKILSMALLGYIPDLVKP